MPDGAAANIPGIGIYTGRSVTAPFMPGLKSGFLRLRIHNGNVNGNINVLGVV